MASLAMLPRGSTVMLVDPDVRATLCLASLLRQDGYEVQTARDAAKAVELLASFGPPDVLVLELELAAGGGAAVARFALSQRPDTRVVVLTRYPNRFRADVFGATPLAVLSKPLDYHQLLEHLKPAGPAEKSVASGLQARL